MIKDFVCAVKMRSFVTSTKLIHKRLMRYAANMKRYSCIEERLVNKVNIELFYDCPQFPINKQKRVTN